MPATDDFFVERQDQSEVKSQIVVRMFDAWANIVGSVTSSSRADATLAYIDLYAGPGLYADGSKSTPLLIIEKIIAKPTIARGIETMFNDVNPEHAEKLREAIAAIPGIETLRHKPTVSCEEIDQRIERHFVNAKLVPTFSFLDPFGYKWADRWSDQGVGEGLGFGLRILFQLSPDQFCDNKRRVSTAHGSAVWQRTSGGNAQRCCADDAWPARRILSPGCTNCYAMRMAARLEAMGQEKYTGLTKKTSRQYVWTGKVRLDPASLELPATWKKPRMIFVNSMSDLFHEDVPKKFVKAVFKVMADTPQHTYQVLTKRAERLEEFSPSLRWPQNVWMGVSVERKDFTSRIDCLRRTGARTKFLSLEPLLGPLKSLDLNGIDWVIAGGESGPRARPMDAEWVRDIRDQCTSAGVAFHFKQWGGVVKSKTGRELDGRTWDELPAVAL